MSFLFSGAKGHRDPELADANRRQREHFARDINDQRTLAAGGEVPGQRRRSPWLLLAAVTAFFLLAAFVRGGGNPFPIERSCTQAALVTEARVVVSGDNLRVRTTGPQDAQYILTFDGEPVQGQPDQQVTFTSTPEGPAYTLTDCVSATFLVQSPIEVGLHELALVAYDAAGARTVATVALTVTD
ncbi:MAG: hypothetical protein H0V67_12440 [Geodermatophilaceae bacterium]|nr:hypothetical protein [Geodermatophilaceae bacterium]